MKERKKQDAFNKSFFHESISTFSRKTRPFIRLKKGVQESQRLKASRKRQFFLVKVTGRDVIFSMDQTGSPLASKKTGVCSHGDTLDERSSLSNRCDGPLASSESVLSVEEVNTFSCVYQVHLTQHARVWDGIARVNEEILLTMLDIFEKHESKSVHVDMCSTCLQQVIAFSDLSFWCFLSVETVCLF